METSVQDGEEGAAVTLLVLDADHRFAAEPPLRSFSSICPAPSNPIVRRMRARLFHADAEQVSR